MSITDTAAALVRTGSAEQRAALVAGLRDLADAIEHDPGFPLPGVDGHVRLPIPVPGRCRGERVEALAVISERLGADIVPRNGALVAERRFGPVTAGGHICDDDFYSRLLEAVDGRDAAGSAA